MGSHQRERTRKLTRKLTVEPLETRLVPYSVSGNAWPHPQLVTISFEPDGTYLGAGISSNLFATFNGRFGSPSAWQPWILAAAQQWAQRANLNFAVGNDNGAGIGAGPDQQGNPAIGDIRIGGYNFGTGDLAATYMPPPVDNFSVAGDIQFNTAQPFNIGTTYDLYTVSVHEFGHALGLLHSAVPAAEMFPAYLGVKWNLTGDDVAGIQAIYGARTADQYDAGGGNNTFQTATPVAINSTLTGLIPSADITTTGDVDYYSAVAPSGTNGTLTVVVQSTGISLLAPTVTVYDASQSPLATAVGVGQSGSTLTLTVSGISAGQTYYVKVAPTDGSANGTGAYGLSLNFGSGRSPGIPIPNTTTLNGNPLTMGGGTPESKGTPEGRDIFDPTEGLARSSTAVVSTSAVGFANPNVQTIRSDSGAYGLPSIAPAGMAVSAASSYSVLTPAMQQSGGGENYPDYGFDALWLNEMAPPDAAPVRPDKPVGDAGVSKQSAPQWKDLTSACFEEALVTQPKPAEDPNDSGAAEISAVDCSGAALGMAALLGGYTWQRRDDETERGSVART
jgi:hypothetical protein